MSFLNYGLSSQRQQERIPHHLYIIAGGEFEITIKTILDKPIQADTSQLVSFLRPQTSVVPTTAGSVKNSNKLTKTQKIVVVGPGNLLALEDIARM